MQHGKRSWFVLLAVVLLILLSTTVVSAQGPQPTPQPIPAQFFSECTQVYAIVNGCRCSQPETRKNLVATYEALGLAWPDGWTPGKSVWLIDGSYKPATVGQIGQPASGKTSASATSTPLPTYRSAVTNATPANPVSTPVPLTFSTRGDPTSSPDQGPPLGLIIGGSLVLGLATVAALYFVILPRLIKKGEVKKS